MQTELFSCSGGVYTQTTDVEGEVNGLLTYDRRVLRPNQTQWYDDIQALYAAAASRAQGNGTGSSKRAEGGKRLLERMMGWKGMGAAVMWGDMA